MTPRCNSLAIFSLNPLRYYRCLMAKLFSQRAGSFQPQTPRGLAMDQFQKKRRFLLPIEVMIALAINVVVAVLSYYAIMMWGFLRG